MARRLAAALLPVLVLSAARAYGEEPKPLLVNGDFAAWDGLSPRGWQNAEGARYGMGPASKVTKGQDGGVRFEGDAQTGSWRMLGQALDLSAGGTYRLSFEARYLGEPFVAGGKNNVYAGVRLTGPAGPQFLVDFVYRAEWTPGEVVFRSGQGKAEALVFLSRPGALEVRSLKLEKLEPKQSFDVLARSMGRYYPFFTHAKVDWTARVNEFRDRAALAEDARSFAALLSQLLEVFHDVHIWYRMPGRGPAGAGLKPIVPNIDARLKEQVKDLRPASKGAQLLVGTLEPGIPYACFTSLEAKEDDAKSMESAVLALLAEAKGLVLDLRGNKGGNETVALQIVRHLADEPRLYARRYVRSGPGPDDFSPPIEAWIRPVANAAPFQKPIVVLLGPACVSSGEGMAQMLDVLPHVRTVGQPTRGASGSPALLPLPNDFDLWFSRWKNLQADGTELEGRGVQPDVLVDHKGDGDPTLAAGLAELKRWLAK